jgi:alcohol dehydrogenase class IV
VNLFQKEFAIPPRILFNNGSFGAIPAECLRLGARGTVVHGRAFAARVRAWNKAVEALGAADRFFLYPYSGGEPTLDNVTALLRFAREKDSAFICGIGGGSTLDLAKAAAGLFHAKEPPSYYQDGGLLEQCGIPFIAAPTTAGSGAEATPNAVIMRPDRHTKLSIRDSGFLAQVIVLDGELLSGLPEPVLKASALDAWVQAYESYVSNKATWMTDTLSLKAFALIYENMWPVLKGEDPKAMSHLMLGSFMAGAALANARLGVIHGLAHPLGALYRQPHGLVCASCLLPSIRFNREAMGAKYDALSKAIGGDLLERARQRLEEFQIVSPFKGAAMVEKELIIRETLASGSTAANPRPVTREDVEFLLSEIF